MYPTSTAPVTTTTASSSSLSSYYLPPITTHLSFSSILHKKVLDQSEQQWESDVSQVMWFDHIYLCILGTLSVEILIDVC